MFHNIRPATVACRRQIEKSQATVAGRMLWNMQRMTVACRRQIEKSPLAQIEMSLSAVSVGEHWADDGDYDEPDGDRPDERVARSGGWQDQDRRGIDVDGAWAASGVSAGEGV